MYIEESHLMVMAFYNYSYNTCNYIPGRKTCPSGSTAVINSGILGKTQAANDFGAF